MMGEGGLWKAEVVWIHYRNTIHYPEKTRDINQDNLAVSVLESDNGIANLTTTLQRPNRAQ
jgi:hypothetical protein